MQSYIHFASIYLSIHIFIIFMLFFINILRHKFPSFSHVLEKITDGPKDRRTDGRTGGWAGAPTEMRGRI